ncbi:MAG: hypothetical protein GX825_02685 [Syntrophomonadaceae bacterium]|nr:hypothetical protein [Syntrophomonadaceae bacterium]
MLELMAALAISAVILGAMGGLLINGSRAYGRVDQYSELQDNGRVGLEMLTRDFKSSRQVTWIGEGEVRMIGVEGSSIVYRVSNGVLYRVVPGTSNPVCMQVAEFTVEEAFSDLLKVKLITENQEARYLLETQVMRRGD